MPRVSSSDTCHNRSAVLRSYEAGDESTLKVATGRRGNQPHAFLASAAALAGGRAVAATDDEDARHLAGCGTPEPGTDLLIVNPDTLVPCLRSKSVRSKDQACRNWRAPSSAR